MATQYKTPGVYIQEPNSFPPSIVGVETAVPCFIGYTQYATDGDGRDLLLTPKRIDSLAEFIQFFGTGFPEQYYLVAVTQPAAEKTEANAAKPDADAKKPDASSSALPGGIPSTDRYWGKISLGSDVYYLAESGTASFNLFNSLRLFYANGGGACYIISCGGFEADGQAKQVTKKDLIDGINASAGFIGPTMLVVPDATLLALNADADAGRANFNDVAGAMLQVCGKTQDRMAILDVYGADQLQPNQQWEDVVEDFRAGLANQPREIWKYGAAYFPPLVTSVVSADEVTIGNLDLSDNKGTTLRGALAKLLIATYPADTPPNVAETPGGKPNEADKPETGDDKDKNGDAAKSNGDATVLAALSTKGQTIYKNYVSLLQAPAADDSKAVTTDTGQPPAIAPKQLTAALNATVPGFQKLLSAIAATQGVLPASAAMAGVWATNDRLVGVWNAPANTGITTLIMPKLPVNDEQQGNLNVPVEGLAVNAIRTFQGRGNLVWGARTLDSLSNDWRYIQVRRTMIYIEQSVKQALEAMVFKPNTAQTWVTVSSMIESFLHNVWAAGGLMGNSPGEAYRVAAGLGSTMTPDDVLNGVMRVQIVLQMVHPAEFIELTFKQQMLGGA